VAFWKWREFPDLILYERLTLPLQGCSLFEGIATRYRLASWYWMGSSSYVRDGLASPVDAFMMTIFFYLLFQVEWRGSGTEGAWRNWSSSVDDRARTSLFRQRLLWLGLMFVCVRKGFCLFRDAVSFSGYDSLTIFLLCWGILPYRSVNWMRKGEAHRSEGLAGCHNWYSPFRLMGHKNAPPFACQSFPQSRLVDRRSVVSVPWSVW
jgi:hypothetical protein